MAGTVLAEIWQKVDSIEGWLTFQEADLLYRLCQGTWCEVGSWKGKSAVLLAQKAPGYAVDWFKGSSEHETTDTYGEFMVNIKRHSVEDKITVIKKPYQKGYKEVTKPLQSYEDTKKAFELYEPLVEKGGYIVLHDVWGYSGEREDTPWPGVTRFARDLLEDDRFEHVEDAQRCMAVKKL